MQIRVYIRLIRIENGNDYIIAMPQSMMDGAQAPESYAETSMEFEKGTIQVYQQDGATPA